MKRLLPVLLALLSIPAHAADGKVPAQFIAKIHTEALGSAPDPVEWLVAAAWFEANACKASTLKAWGSKAYLSSGYRSRDYDAAAELLTLYRGVLNREPDGASFRKRLNARRGGQSWSATVDSFFDSQEFQFLALRICGPESGYSFGTRPVLDLPVTGEGFRGTGNQLQKLLNAAAPTQSVVYLAQKAVIRLTSPLVIPPNVTLATVGHPDPTRYALMARLVRAGRFKTAAVSLHSGARLQNVWVDGQRGVNGFIDDGLNVRLLGGDGTSITESVITNAAGWSSVQAFGRSEGFPCGHIRIAGNLVTAYSSGHVRGRLKHNPWTDGLSISCENAFVHDNQIVDATDVAIVLFRAHPAVQRSFVRNNRIIAAGNSAYGAITIDGLEGKGTKPDFHGAYVQDNTFWTGPDTHFDIAISVGTRAWFGAPADMASGVTVTGNTTADIPTRVDTGIAVSGMLDARVADNDLNLILVDVSRCPNSTGPESPKTVRVGASVAAGHASGELQPYTDALYDWCIGH